MHDHRLHIESSKYRGTPEPYWTSSCTRSSYGEEGQSCNVYTRSLRRLAQAQAQLGGTGVESVVAEASTKRGLFGEHLCASLFDASTTILLSF